MNYQPCAKRGEFFFLSSSLAVCISTAEGADGCWQLLLQRPWGAPGALIHPVVAMQPHSSSGPSGATGFFAICGLLFSVSATCAGHGLLQRSLNKILNFYLCGYLKNAFTLFSWRNPFQIALEQEFQLLFNSERQIELTVNR